MSPLSRHLHDLPTYLLLLLALTLALAACGDSRGRADRSNRSDVGQLDADHHTDDANNPDTEPDVPDLDPARCEEEGLDPVAGLSQRCCLDYGIDACGPGLFCAAYDGREFAACYANHSRTDGASCTADNECQSYRCNRETGRCKASPNTTCTPTDGCGPGPETAANYVCAAGTCQKSTGAERQPCATHADCQSQICMNNQCTAGRLGDACTAHEHCQSQSCVQNQCTDKSNNSPCTSPADCTSNICVSGRCSAGNLDDSCTIPEHCTSNICVSGRCSAGNKGDFCTDAAHCQSEICVNQRCESGDMGSPCTTSTDCAGALKCERYCSDPDCRSLCTDGALGSPCLANEGCENNLRCTSAKTWGSWLQPFNTCAEQETCSFKRQDCQQESEQCLRTPDGELCGMVGTRIPYESCTEDADCITGICENYDNNTRLCSSLGAWGAPCENYFPEPGSGYSSYTKGCDDYAYQCNAQSSGTNGSGVFYGQCGLKKGQFCKFTHDTTPTLYIGGCVNGGLDACQPYTLFGKLCEYNPAIRCNTDIECGTNGRCMSPYTCKT